MHYIFHVKREHGEAYAAHPHSTRTLLHSEGGSHYASTKTSSIDEKLKCVLIDIIYRLYPEIMPFQTSFFALYFSTTHSEPAKQTKKRSRKIKLQ